MALTVKHTFVSAKGDGSDATLVRPSNWNANHDIELASNRIIGRLTAGPGDAEELPVTPYMIGLLNHANYAALAAVLGLPTTGDARLTFKQVADAGWVLANDGSIGDVGSGATVVNSLPNTPTQALFTFFYDTMWEGFAPLQNSAGGATTRAAQGTAATAFAAKCRMVLPKTLGRAIVVANGGAPIGAGLTQRFTGQTGGTETHVLTESELAAHVHIQQGTFAGAGTSAGSGGGSGSGTAAVYGEIHADTGGDSPDHAHHMNYTSGWKDINHLHGISVAATGSWVHGHGVSGGTKGGTTNVGVQAGGSYLGLAYAGDNTITIGGTDLNHAHGASSDWMDRSAGHDHSIVGDTWGTVRHAHHVDFGVSSSGSCTLTALSVSVAGSANVNTTISGYTTPSGSNVAHNNMQPWVGMSVMIKL